ncbi:MAG: MGMT family protein [Clostridia bacterium]|nr:MGMT family protein [Clostridia bacterium]
MPARFSRGQNFSDNGNEIETSFTVRIAGSGDRGRKNFEFVLFGSGTEFYTGGSAGSGKSAACRKNAVLLIVPCHRVVASDGIGGYGGRPDIKRAILRLEGNTAYEPTV